ncbi:MAG: carbon-nitrogen family hydrolase [Desulfobacteraceae bacterium]|nr:carbon-nitrogen family hydrolase [Desulfobacteraceae bacterium]
MQVASIQMSVIENDKAAAIEKACECIVQCRDADLVILPELWNIGFMSFDRYHSEAEDRNGPTLAAMVSAAHEAKIFLHTGSFVEKIKDKYFNSSYLISPQGQILANYRKIHLFGYNSLETRLLCPGEQIAVADTPFGKIGLATCFDLRFPELFRRMVEQGAQIFLICSAWPYPRLEHWLMLNRVRALENQCFLISANSTGMNRNTMFTGHSMVVDPWGIALSCAGDRQMNLKNDVDLSQVNFARQQFPALAGRVDWVNSPGSKNR